jgi:hypothetical protein
MTGMGTTSEEPLGSLHCVLRSHLHLQAVGELGVPPDPLPLLSLDAFVVRVLLGVPEAWGERLMKISLVTPDDPFCRRKCAACKRLARVGQVVFTSFRPHEPSPRCWFILHATCVGAGRTPIDVLIRELSDHLDKAMIEPTQVQYFVLREQILRTKEAFPNAAA